MFFYSEVYLSVLSIVRCLRAYDLFCSVYECVLSDLLKELQCGEHGEGSGGGEEDGVSRKSTQLSDENEQHTLDRHRGW